MVVMLKQFFSFLRMLNSETDTNQIAAGFAFGLVLGFSPFLSLQTLLVLILLFIFRIQIGAAFLSAFVFKFVAYLLDPICDWIGRGVLESPSLRPLFVELYNMPLVPLTRFNNSIVMGSGVLAFVLVIPSFFLFHYLVRQYRATVVARFQRTKFWKLVRATAFYKWFAKYEELYG